MVVAKKKAGKKTPLSAPLAAKKAKAVKKNPLFEKKARNYRIGADIQPKRDMTRFVKWPKFIQLQRKKRILLQRVKVPPCLAQFNNGIDKNMATKLLTFLKKYSPETKALKKERLVKLATEKKEGKDTASKKPVTLKFGLNHVTQLVEEKKAKLVVISHDVDPIELVCWLPALCRKKDVPYCIIKGKSRLGQLVHQKTASAVALTGVQSDDQKTLNSLRETFTGLFNDNVEHRRKWGGGIMGVKSQHVQQKKEKLIAAEQAKKMGLQLS
eukprot:GEMP01073172.1.p1 GENE.GEMP01073172.1~~GEMP01073172.1.p1  ORF type:complete len:269 (+),score=81.93 GEMP01073172.1:35-841(+)